MMMMSQCCIKLIKKRGDDQPGSQSGHQRRGISRRNNNNNRTPPNTISTIQTIKGEIQESCGRVLSGSLHELTKQIEQFQTSSTTQGASRMMDKQSFKSMLGILGNYLISDRIFQGIDTDMDGYISLEEYLVYNDIISYGTPSEKNYNTFCKIDHQRRGLVNFNEFKEFFYLYIELYTQILNYSVPTNNEEYLLYTFNQISQGHQEFNFAMFEEAKSLVPRLFDFLEQPGIYMRDFLALISS